MIKYIPTGRHGILVKKFVDGVIDSPAITPNMSGHFRLEARCPARYKGARVLADFDNLITDAGMLRCVQNTPLFDGVTVSTSTTPPVVTDTILGGTTVRFTTSAVADSFTRQTTTPRYDQRTYNYRSNPGVATGTWSKIGMSLATGLWSAALIVDNLGNPITITILADEYLDVYYTVRVYWPEGDVTGSSTISGSSYAWVLRAANLTQGEPLDRFRVNGFSGGNTLYAAVAYSAVSTLGAITSIPSPATGSVSSNPVPSQSGSAVKWTQTYSPTATPPGGVGCVSISFGLNYASGSNNWPGFQQSFTPAIPKTSSTVLTLNNTVTPARYP